ncbi:MAG: HAD-IC family P-type ATPase [Chloroflexota bacterium]|nr:cation-translocating P-type ATPase [Dehalococcoidia bacterium]MDW8046679.1 HAD-IC family P-type ATPase [Chloroflexota bacterium]
MTAAEPTTLAGGPLAPGDIPPGWLTSQEAAARAARGLVNVDTSRLRSDADVIRANVLTFFNVILAVLIAGLLFVGQFRDAFFVGIVTAANVVVSTIQELKATRTLRRLRALTAPRVHVIRDGVESAILAQHVVQGDLIHLRPGDQVVADGHVVARSAEVDESLLTGESDAVLKQPGDELLSGSFCTAGDLFYRAERVGNDAYIVRLTADARQLVRRLTPLQIRFRRILRMLLIATGVLAAALMIQYNVQQRGFTESLTATTALITTVVPVGLLLGMTVAFAVGAVRVSRAGAIVQDIAAVEALNYTDVICLDKTGTITANQLELESIVWLPGMEGYRPWLAAFAVATENDSKTAGALAAAIGHERNAAQPTGKVPFSSERRWSALELTLGSERRAFVLGAPETVLALCDGGEQLRTAYERAVERGLRGVVFAEAPKLPSLDGAVGRLRPLGLALLRDVLRPEVREAFALMKQLGIEPKIISGDNPHTVAALLGQLQIRLKGGTISGPELDGLAPEEFARAVEEHSIFGRIAPHQKAAIVDALRKNRHFVAMVGDGANDVQALRTADVAVAMASGTSMTRAVAGIVLLRDSFEALIRGAQEATFVLGNTARLSKLFLAKSFYAYLLIVATNLLGLDFPFLPRQGSVTALLTLGIPAIFISISVPPPEAGRDFTRNVLRFALPASAAAAVAAIGVHLFTQGLLGRDIAEARTLVSLTLGIIGLIFVIEVLGLEGASWRSLTRPVMTFVLAGVLLGGLVLTVYVDWLRDFFGFTAVGAWEWSIVVTAVVLAIAGQYVFSRYWPQILDWLTGAHLEAQAARGRAL